jgi:methyl-accepting chemotaxis protein
MKLNALLKNQKAGTQIIAWVIIISVIGIAASIIGYTSIGSLGKSASKYRAAAKDMQQLQDLEIVIEKTAMPVNEIIITHELAEKDAYAGLRADVDKRIGELEKLMMSDEEKQSIKDLKQGLVDADQKAQKVFDAYASKEAPILMGDFDVAIVAASERIDRLNRLLSKKEASFEQDMVASESTSKKLQIFLILFNLAVSVGAVFFMLKQIVNPLRDSFLHISDAVRRIVLSTGEISRNSEQVNEAANQVAGAISQVASGSADQSRATSESLMIAEQIKAAIEQVAQGAQSQARSVSDSVNGVSMLAGSIDMVSNKAHAVSEVATTTKDTATQGKETVGKAIDGMGKIKSTVEASAAKIQELGEKSKQIGEIIEVIDDIAEQTNLLALNAAIEAARAGEHGKGFAVVADEVRKLAERSAKATGEIANLIKGIQDETMHAVSAMEAGMAEVEQGSELAENAGSAIAEMMTAINEVVSQISEVTDAAAQMAAASSQVSQAMDQIAAITEQNTAATQEVAASADQVAHSVNSVAAAAEEAAASAEEVSASTEEQAASVEQIAAQVQALAGMSQELDGLVASFNL